MPLPIRKTDKGGRLSLGAEYANLLAEVTKVNDSELRVRFGDFVPKDEKWLHENKLAMEMVRDGLAAAKRGDFVEGPDIDADAD